MLLFDGLEQINFSEGNASLNSSVLFCTPTSHNPFPHHCLKIRVYCTTPCLWSPTHCLAPWDGQVARNRWKAVEKVSWLLVGIVGISNPNFLGFGGFFALLIYQVHEGWLQHAYDISLQDDVSSIYLGYMEVDKDFSGTLSTAHHPSTIPFFKKSGVERHLKITLQRTLNCRDPTEAQCTHSVCSVARRPRHDSLLHCAESLWGTAEVPNMAVVTAYGACQLNCTGLVCALCLGYADKNSSKNCLCACACVPFQISRVPDAASSLLRVIWFVLWISKDPSASSCVFP